jgi:hypothetical protein
MIQLIEGAPEGVLAFEAVGEVDAEDYEEVLKPALEAALEGGEDLRIVYEIGPDFDRYSGGAAWEDVAAGFAHLTEWRRCAMVTDREWVADAAKAFGWLMGGRLRVFDIDELRAALEWASEDDD